MFCQRLGDGLRIRRVALHAQRQRLDAPEYEIGIERRGDAAGHGAQQVELLAELRSPGHQHSAEYIGVPA